MSGSARSTLVSAAELPAVSRWQAPDVTGPQRLGNAPQGPERLITADQLAALEAEAREAGFRRGREEGCAAGLAERQREAERLRELIEALALQREIVDDDLLQRLGALVRAATRQLVRRELRAQPDEVVGVIREALAALPDPQARVTLRLHPNDAALVREAWGVSEAAAGWNLLEDPAITPGGVLLDTGTSTLDATVEGRLEAVLGRLLPDTRAERTVTPGAGPDG